MVDIYDWLLSKVRYIVMEDQPGSSVREMISSFNTQVFLDL